MLYRSCSAGNQEAGRRAGTENVPAIVGFGEAARLAALELNQRGDAVATLRDRLEQVLFQSIKGCYINGMGQPRIPNTTNMGFDGIDGDTLAGVLNGNDIYVSTGSACSANTLMPSHVVMAMTGSYERAGEAVRFSLSHLNTDAEIAPQLLSSNNRSLLSGQHQLLSDRIDHHPNLIRRE